MIEQVLLSKIYAVNLRLDSRCCTVISTAEGWVKDIAPHGQRSKSLKKVASVHTNCKCVASNNKRNIQQTSEHLQWKNTVYICPIIKAFPGLYLDTSKAVSGDRLLPRDTTDTDPDSGGSSEGSLAEIQGSLWVWRVRRVQGRNRRRFHRRNRAREKQTPRDKRDAVHREFTLRLRADVTRDSSFYF